MRRNIINFDQKSYYRDENTTVYPIDFEDFNFRVSMQTEKRFKL